MSLQKEIIKIGTRASKLAMWQAEFIADQLHSAGFKTEILPIETKGDKILDRTLSKIGSKGVFTEELENGLRDGTFDIAVHSAKDMPSQLDNDLALITYSEREKSCDVLVSNKSGLDISQPITIGTSSTRRVALLKHYYPHVNIVDMRGNLQTRFGKMENGICDALLLAYAGVHRMGLEMHIIKEFSADEFTPPTGQGSVTIEVSLARMDKSMIESIRAACNHAETEKVLLTERAFLAEMNGGCSIPTFANATLIGDQISLSAGIVSLDGQSLIRKFGQDPDPRQLGKSIAQEVLSSGGDNVLESIKRTLNS